jgi:CubicO group peptidase (beta-lactamase class C family)
MLSAGLNKTSINELGLEMKNTFKLFCYVLTSVVILLVSACDKDKEVCAGIDCFSLEMFGKNIESKLTGKCVGFGYFISYNNGEKIYFGSGGEGRRPQDPPAQVFSIFKRMNIASMSKTITGVAAVKLLNNKGISLDTAIASWLPADWTIGTNSNLITFGDLLNHTSGIRADLEVTYENLKTAVAMGVSLSDRGIYEYRNINFALFRILIPRLNGFISTSGNPAQDYADAYINYVNTNVLEPSGIFNATCSADFSDPGRQLCYQFPYTTDNGTDWGDMTLTNASRGWNLSVVEVKDFMNTFEFTQEVISAPLRELMKLNLLGFQGIVSTPGGTGSYIFHGGGYPGDRNPGEFNGIQAIFNNDIIVVLMINSQASGIPYAQIIGDSFDKAWIK